MGHLSSDAFPTLGNLPKSLGTFDILVRRNQNQITCAHLCRHSEIVLVEKNMVILEVSTCLLKINRLLLLTLWGLSGF